MNATPDLLYSEEEEALRSAVRALLADHCEPSAVLARSESQEPHDPALWKALTEGMGLAGLLVPEHLGGQGATPRETAVVLEELGRSVAPVPYLTSAVIATEALLACVDEQGASAAATLLRALASGRTVAALAVPFSLAPAGGAPAAPTVSGQAGQSDPARHSGLSGQGGLSGQSGPSAGSEVLVEGGLLTGRITGVADAVAADVLLVPATGGLYAVDVAQKGVTVTAATSLDRTRPVAAVDLRAAPGQLLTTDTDSALQRALRAGAGLLASEQLGIAEWCLTETVRHTRDRHQFNRPVGSFQAVKHRLAHLWLETVHARAAARNAADTLAAPATPDDETALAVALAQAYTSRVAVHAAEEALQLHGGIGMTWEHPVHLYLKRAKADSIALGTAGRHRDRLAALAGLDAPVN